MESPGFRSAPSSAPLASGTRKAILVLGMHRSGTSAVTRMLNLCGADLGRHLLPPKQDNERGFWENENFLNLHEAVLAQLNTRWHDLAQFPADWRCGPGANSFAQSLRRTLADEFGDSDLVVIKDPRLSLLAPLWEDALKSGPVRPVFVIVVRHPDEVAASLGKRDRLSISHSRTLWLQHMIESVRATQECPRVFVLYDNLLRDWRHELDRIQLALGISFPGLNVRVEEEIDRFIEPCLRHHRYEDAGTSSHLPLVLDQLYQYLRNACNDGPAGASETFERIAADFDAQLQVMGPFIRDLSATIVSDHERHGRELDRVREVIRSKDEEIEQSRLSHRARDDLESALRAEIVAAGERLAKLRDDHLRVSQALRTSEERRRDDLAVMRKSRDEIEAAYQSEVRAARSTIDNLAEEIDRARAAHHARDGELQAARTTIDGLAEDIERARAAHRSRDITERVLLDHIAAVRGSIWFRAGRALRIVSAPQPFVLTTPTPECAPPSSSRATVHFAIDSPGDDSCVEGVVYVTGWCFDTVGSVAEIRIRCNDRATTAELGLHRPDVAAAFATCTGIENCGFSAAFAIGEGTHSLIVETRIGDSNDWHILGLRTVTSRPARLRIELDTPGRMFVDSGTLRMSGWGTHPHARIMDLSVQVGDAKVACQYRLERPDVGAALPGIPGAAHSGFEATLDVPPGKWPVTFSAVLEDGSECILEWPHALRSRRLPWRRRLSALAATRTAWIRLALREGRRWVSENRRLPRAHELPQLIRLSRELHKQRNASAQVAAPPGFRMPEIQDRYAAWQDRNAFTSAARSDLERRLAAYNTLPPLSVVMPVYNPPLQFLRQAIDSLRTQVFANWELCIADDASTDEEVHDYLRELTASDPRVRVCLRNENGNISAATNSAAALAHGEFLVFFDQDDLLTPDALAEIALAAAACPEADILYSDDDKIDTEGRRFAPQFKPDWSPELLLGYMYFSHVFAVRRSVFERLDGMRLGFEGSQDYDLALRASEQARAIIHIPQVLYHWRVLPGSTAASGAAKPESFEAGRRAVAEALQRRGMAAAASQPDWAIKANCGIFSAQFPDHGPKVSILIPTRNGLDILRRCIDSLAHTSYRDFEIVVIDNESDDSATLDYLNALPHRVERIANPAGRFSFAGINNRAAERVDGEYLLFLNNDTEIVEPRWLSQMMGYAQMAGVGAVGARLLYPDKRIQHAGIVHGYYHGLAGPAFKLAPAWDNGYLSYARVTRNYSAVTAACMLTPRKLFLDAGGFDETRFEVAYNDVDYCYRLAARGLRSVYCAEAELMHHEGHSRGFDDRPQEIAAFRDAWSGFRDPYYSPHLSLRNERFEIQPRRWRTHGPAVRTLMCSFNLNWEGAPYSQLELTLELKRQGFIDPVVYAPVDGPLRQAYEDAGIAVHVFKHPLAGVFTEGAYDIALEEFAEFIRSSGADVVYGNTLQTFYAIDAAHRIGLPTLWNPRESEPWQTYFNFLPAPLAARALRCFEYPYRVIFVADATRAVWQPIESRYNFTVIHNGLNLARLHAQAERFPREQCRNELGIGNDELAIFLPGTVCERKGQHDLIGALSQLPEQLVAGIRVFIVGDRAGSYSLELHKYVAALPPRWHARVQIVKETDEIVRYYQAADIFVCTSRIESFPRVVLEAMAFGLPIVSTRVFGVVEQVRENVNAFLYAPGDVHALTRQLEILIRDGELRTRFSENSPHVLATLNTFEEMTMAYGQIVQEAALTGTFAPEMDA